MNMHIFTIYNFNSIYLNEFITYNFDMIQKQLKASTFCKQNQTSTNVLAMYFPTTLPQNHYIIHI